MSETISNENADGAQVDGEKGQCDNLFLPDLCSNGEMLRFNPLVHDGCGNFVMKKSHDGDEVGRTPTSGQPFQRVSRLIESKGLVKSGKPQIVPDLIPDNSPEFVNTRRLSIVNAYCLLTLSTPCNKLTKFAIHVL